MSARGRLDEAIFATGIPFKGKGDAVDHKTFLAEMGGVMAVSAGVRRWGTASLDLAYVAAGRFDGYWERGIHPWDVAAGIVLVREAGGLVSEIDGGADVLNAGQVVAANDRLYDSLRSVLRRASAN